MPATDVSLHKFIELKPLWVGKVGAAGVASTVATTIPANSLAGLTNGNVYVVTVNRTNAAGTVKNPASQRETFIGKVSGSDFINCSRAVEGTAQAWAADTVLEVLVSASLWNKLLEGIEVEHNADGTHKNTILALLAGAQTFTGIKTFTTGLLKVADIIDTTQSLKVLVFAGVASAVNWIKMTSAATGNSPVTQPDGSDTNVGWDVKMKGTGKFRRPTIVQLPVGSASASLAVGDGQAFFRVPAELNGMNLTGVASQVYTAGTTGAHTTQIRRVRSGAAADMLSTKITIDSTEVDTSTAATPAVIDTANDDVQTGDLICIDIDVVQTTPAKGQVVEMRFELP